MQTPSNYAAMLQWSEMLQQGIQPTSFTYSAKVKVESSIGEFDEALHTIQEMQTQGIMPDKVTWHVILFMAKQMNRPDIVQQASFNQQALLTIAVSALLFIKLPWPVSI